MIQYKTDTHTDEEHQKHHKHDDKYVKTNRQLYHFKIKAFNHHNPLLTYLLTRSISAPNSLSFSLKFT